MSIAIASVTLGDRKRRRQFITGLLFFALAYFGFGYWMIDGWLGKDLWRMLFYWGFLMLLLLFLMVLALFDGLAVIGEERRKLGLSRQKIDEEIPRE